MPGTLRFFGIKDHQLHPVYLIAVEHQDRVLGRVRLQHIYIASAGALIAAVRDMIA